MNEEPILSRQTEVMVLDLGEGLFKVDFIPPFAKAAQILCYLKRKLEKTMNFDYYCVYCRTKSRSTSLYL